MTWTGSYIVKLPKKTKLLKFYKILTDRESSHMQPSVLFILWFFITVWGDLTRFLEASEARFGITYGQVKNNFPTPK